MKILVTGAWTGANEHIEEIEKAGHTVKFMQWEKESLPCEASWAEAVICGNLFNYHEISSFTNLKVIQLLSAGIDHLDLDYIKEKGIALFNSPEVYHIPIAEHVILGVLSLYRKAFIFYENQKKHTWEKQRGLLELYGKDVSIFGTGNIGKECAKRFKAFGCNVTGVNRSGSAAEGFDKVIKVDEKEKALAADVIVLAMPINEENKKMFSKEVFAQIKEGAIFVNIARGTIVDEKALEEALSSGHLGGAVLDVFEEEPLSSESALWELENVIITPHNSYLGDGIAARRWKTIRENLGIDG